MHNHVRLTEEEKHSSAWRKVSQFVERHIERYSLENESLVLGKRRTTELRARIHELKQLLALAKPARDFDPEQVQEPPS